MAAITWANVNGRSSDGSVRSLEGASRSFEAMSNNFSDIIKKREATQTANWDQGKLNNTNALLGAVQEARTPEEYAAKEAQLREQLLGYGAQVDPLAARNALDGRMATLQQRNLASMQYGNAVVEQADAPNRDLAMSLYAQGNFAEGDAAAASVQRNKAALFEASRTGQRRVTTEGQADTTFANGKTKFDQERLLYPNQVTKSNNDLLIQEANIKKINAEAAQAERDNLYGSKEDREAQSKAFQGVLDNSFMANGTFTSKKGSTAISTAMKAYGLSGDNVQSVHDKVLAKFPNGIEIPSTVKGGKPTYLPLPADFVMQAIGHTDDNVLSYLGGTYGGRVADNLQKLIENPVTRERLMEGYKAQIDFDTGGNNRNTPVSNTGPDALPDVEALRAVLTSVSPVPADSRFNGVTSLDTAIATRKAKEAEAQKKTLMQGQW